MKPTIIVKLGKINTRFLNFNLVLYTQNVIKLSNNNEMITAVVTSSVLEKSTKYLELGYAIEFIICISESVVANTASLTNLRRSDLFICANEINLFESKFIKYARNKCKHSEVKK